MVRKITTMNKKLYFDTVERWFELNGLLGNRRVIIILRFSFFGNNSQAMQIILLIISQAISLLILFVPQLMTTFFKNSGKNKL